jgi:two-component system response regulator RegA
MSKSSLERILVVEDVETLARRLAEALAAPGRVVRHVQTVHDAWRELLEFRPELLVTDVVLPDGTAVDLLERGRAQDSAPAVVAISGAADPGASFRLAQLGVRAFLKKPVTLPALDLAVSRALNEPPDLAPHLRGSVGRRPVREVEGEVRRTMVKEALARSGGSRRGAARLLSISRQLLQHVLRGLDPSV